jgi:hypothetical protein
VEKIIWCELMQLHTVHKKEPTKKFVGRERETAEEESKKHHPVSLRWRRDDLSTGEADIGGFRLKPFFPHLREILLRKGGTGLANRLFLQALFCHSFVMGDALDGHAMTRHKKVQARTSTKEHGLRRGEGRRRRSGGGGEAES